MLYGGYSGGFSHARDLTTLPPAIILAAPEALREPPVQLESTQRLGS